MCAASSTTARHSLAPNSARTGVGSPITPEAEWRPKSSRGLFCCTGDWGRPGDHLAAHHVRLQVRRQRGGEGIGVSARGGGIADTAPDGVLRQLRHKGTCPVRIPRTEAGNRLAHESGGVADGPGVAWSYRLRAEPVHALCVVRGAERTDKLREPLRFQLDLGDELTPRLRIQLDIGSAQAAYELKVSRSGSVGWLLARCRRMRPCSSRMRPPILTRRRRSGGVAAPAPARVDPPSASPRSNHAAHREPDPP